MDEEHCVIAIQTSEVAKFNMTADKRRYNVFLICSAAPAGKVPKCLKPLPRPRYPSLSKGSGGVETTVQKYNFFSI